MKKITQLMVVLTFCFMANAQDETTYKSQINFGIKGGMNFSLIVGDDTDNFDGKIGFHLGGVLEFPISEKFSLQPELLYSLQGDKSTFDGMEIKFKLDYLNLPMMAKYYVTEGFSLEAGPQVGFLMSAEAEGGGISLDIKDIIKDVDFGLNFGVGYELANGLNFSGRYYVGISNIVENSGSILGEPVDADQIKNQNNVFQLSIGYFF
ncbi:porin family protein [Litoribaculum gwangyangense]|uniref:Porin family protein n=1 Tax=Litoribaculum gwangyangense TaxID=1130722 RepID=A0ABP9CJ84_9FLAO